jgi:hypothetical protein
MDSFSTQDAMSLKSILKGNLTGVFLIFCLSKLILFYLVIVRDGLDSRIVIL